MILELSIGWIVFLNVAIWPVLQFGLAWAFSRAPSDWFHPSSLWTWEQNGRFYERLLAIKQWKDRLPDGGSLFGLGFSKATLDGRNEDYLSRFLQETWRGELCHWTALGFTPIFFLWNPLWADVVMVLYAVGMNLPCILAQRYNRSRFQRLLARKRRAESLRR